MLHLILIPTIAVDILWVNQLVTRANELADSTWLIYFYNYFEGEDIGMAHGPLMLCQSMAPRSWLQAATLRTDRRPQDVAASWAAGSCAMVAGWEQFLLDSIGSYLHCWTLALMPF